MWSNNNSHHNAPHGHGSSNGIHPSKRARLTEGQEASPGNSQSLALNGSEQLSWEDSLFDFTIEDDIDDMLGITNGVQPPSHSPSTAATNTPTTGSSYNSYVDTSNTNSSSSLPKASKRENMSALMAGILQTINTHQIMRASTVKKKTKGDTDTIKELVQNAHLDLSLGFYQNALAGYQQAYQLKHAAAQLSYVDLTDGLRDLGRQQSQQQNYQHAKILLELAYLMIVETENSKPSPYCASLLSELASINVLSGEPADAINCFKTSLRVHLSHLRAIQIEQPHFTNTTEALTFYRDSLSNLDEWSYPRTLDHLDTLLNSWDATPQLNEFSDSGVRSRQTEIDIATQLRKDLHDFAELLMNKPPLPESNSATLSTLNAMIPPDDTQQLPSFAALYAFITSPSQNSTEQISI